MSNTESAEPSPSELPFPLFEPGPPIDGNLIHWLDENASDRPLQMPGEVHGGLRGIDAAYIIGPGIKIPISLDTTALSVGLPLLLAGECEYPCQVWLQGTWGALLDLGAHAGRPVLAVRKYLGVSDAASSRIYISM